MGKSGRERGGGGGEDEGGGGEQRGLVGTSSEPRSDQLLME